MIVIDTSVWVASFRDRDCEESIELRELLDQDLVALPAPVRLEILSGASVQNQQPLRRLLAALPQWLPQRSTWHLIEAWIGQAVAAGQRFGVGDLLIGAIAAERETAVWTLDRDFQRMADLGFLRLYVPGI